jgi:ribA/ribD-fused uncharacterized protein
MAEHLFKVQQATSFDTASFNDPTLLFKKSEQIKAARNTVISSVDDLLENSFVGYLAEVLNDVGEAYSDVLISEKPRVKGVVNAVLKDYINLNDRDFVGLARKTINNLFDWATQIDRKINLSLAMTLLGTDTAQSFAEQIMKFKYTVLNTPKHPLKDNIIINSIQMKKSDKDGVPDNLYLSGKSNKTYNQNQIIYGFKEIKNNVPKQLYGKLVRVAIMQSGLSNSSISFSSLLPYEDFKEIYNDTLANLENMPNLADFIDLNVMERTLYNDANIVPSKKAAWIKTKAKKMMYGLEIKFLSKRLQKAMKNKQIPQMINISKLSREGSADIITYVWEDQSISKAKKAEMRKRGNYSYINRGLFKKVYGTDGNALVYPSTGKDGRVYESYVYKAINTWGDSFRANEFYGKMFPEKASSTLAQQGIFDNGYIKVNEVEDGVIEEIMGDEVFTESGSLIDAYDLAPSELLEDYSQTTGLPVGTPTKINIYAGTGENAELSNFANRPFEYMGRNFKSVEQAFQYFKGNFTSNFQGNKEDIQKKILNSNTGAEAKKLGSEYSNLDKQRWDKESSNIMKIALKSSFEQNPKALETLLATGNAELTHTQDKGKWGKEFPKLLMEVREELKPAPEQIDDNLNFKPGPCKK